MERQVKLTRVLTAALIVTSLASGANAAEFQGYVPRGLAQAGMTWPGADAAEILGCKKLAPATLHASLSKGAADKWREMCFKAHRVHAQLVSGNCFQAQPTSPKCRVGVSADDAIRHDRKFWQIVNALTGKADDYGLDD